MFRPRFLLLAATLLGIAAGVFLGMRPWRVWIAERGEVAAREAELRTARAEHAELAREAAATRSAVGREQKARELGYTRPGEKPLTPR